jgi:hypothetical protein
MTANERKEFLVRLQQESSAKMTGITLTYHGERKEFEAYQIPLSYLTYNPYNGRIGSAVKSYERQNHVLNPNDAEDVKKIEEFLWQSKESANRKTMDSLLDDHQQRYGIVTADGKIIDGNRRASLLNRLWRDDSIDANKKQHCQWFLAIILPVDADKKEILRLETTYQMGEDAKVDYGPIEKYLKCGDLLEAGFTVKDIASFMSIGPTQVEMYLRVLNLMNDYLETYGYDGIYTQLDTNEDSFQKLDAALKGYLCGNAQHMWDYDVDLDVSDLKSIAFDYIRLGLDQNDFRDIIRKPSNTNKSSSIFACKDLWEDFVKKHNEAVENIEEEPVQEILSANPSADTKRLLRRRDNAWKEKVIASLQENYNHHKDKLSNKHQAAEPMKLLQKAWEALQDIDKEQDTFKNDPKVYALITQINELSGDYKKELE